MLRSPACAGDRFFMTCTALSSVLLLLLSSLSGVRPTFAAPSPSVHAHAAARPAAAFLHSSGADHTIVSGALSLAAAAKGVKVLRLPTFFSDHMVLQRAPLAAAVWGWSASGDVVSVTVADQSKTATAASNGLWEVRLDPVKAGGPYLLLVRSSLTADTVQLKDVMFGDVFLCSGQSNMQFTVSMSLNASAEINDSAHYPLLRLFTAAINTSNETLEDLGSKVPRVSWAVSAQAIVGGRDNSYTSAACYFFGRDVYRALGGEVPIGLVVSAVGGTCIEAWSSSSVIDRCVTRNNSMCNWPPASGAHQRLPYTVLYNAMLHPLRRMALAAFIWYQGEQNSQDAGGYQCRLPLFITDVRQKFNRPDLPVLVVQLPANHQGSFVGLRQAQALAVQQLSGVYLVVTIDLGDEKSPYGTIHPRRKQQVGERLSLVVRREVYADDTVADRGPMPLSRTVHNNGRLWTYAISFNFDEQLHINDTADCVVCCAGDTSFELFDSGKRSWVPANITLPASDGQPLLVSAELVGNATGVRYAWSAWPQCALFNCAQLPAAPFLFNSS